MGTLYPETFQDRATGRENPNPELLGFRDSLSLSLATMSSQSDESLGLDTLPPSQLESRPGFGTSPFLEDDIDPVNDGYETNTTSPDQVLRSLISDNGFVVILEALNQLIQDQIARFQDSSMQSYGRQLKSFQDTSEKLTELIETLPAELDIEIALAQVTRVTPAIESTPAKLTDDL
jgi:hypothetical protein